jgi:HK97 family phage prohead protease
MDNEIRCALAELRAEDEGIFEGYIVTWNSVDSYNSTFQRGAFKKTLEERRDKIKVLYNHEKGTVIGVPEEIREDETGVWVRGKLITTVQKAADTYELMKAGAINTLSFGFQAVKQRFERGIRVITEVRLMEISPVVFEANETAKIMNVRSDDYNATLQQKELFRKRGLIVDSLLETMEDIYWGMVPESMGETAEKFDTAIMAFADAHRGWFQELSDFLGVDEEGRALDLTLGLENPLQIATVRFLQKEGITAEQLSQRTALTVEEVETLRNGGVITDPKRLEGIDADMHTAHQQVRSTAVEALCDELRGGINPAESVRLTALLKRSLPQAVDTPPSDADMTGVVEHLQQFRDSLKQTGES